MQLWFVIVVGVSVSIIFAVGLHMTIKSNLYITLS